MEPGEHTKLRPLEQWGSSSTSALNPKPTSKPCARPQLVLRKSTTFWSRLRGLHGLTPLPEHHGMFISPCKAIHTLGMRGCIDVVFVDAHLQVVKRIDSMCANRGAGCWAARSVIELPPGYCQRYPDYLRRIRHALGRV